MMFNPFGFLKKKKRDPTPLERPLLPPLPQQAMPPAPMRYEQPRDIRPYPMDVHEHTSNDVAAKLSLIISELDIIKAKLGVLDERMDIMDSYLKRFEWK